MEATVKAKKRNAVNPYSLIKFIKRFIKTVGDLIKRVIATAGDTVEIKDGRVFVNDQLLNEDYILEKTKSEYPKSTVPKGTIFVMGDNRNNSEDSRFADVGFVPLDLIKGKAMLVFWPVSQLKTLP